MKTTAFLFTALALLQPGPLAATEAEAQASQCLDDAAPLRWVEVSRLVGDTPGLPLWVATDECQGNPNSCTTGDDCEAGQTRTRQGPLYCIDTEWLPPLNEIPPGEPQVQTSNCGTERWVVE